MAKLFVLSGPDVGRSFELGDRVELGRSPECEVRLNHRSVSRRHARIERDGDGWAIVDLDSRNGVKVAGEPVRSATLSDHDEILLGELALRFRMEEDAAVAAAPAPAPESPVEPPVESPVAPPNPAPTAPPREPAPAPGGETGADAGGFELEEEIDLTAPTGPGAPAARPRRRIVLEEPPEPEDAGEDLEEDEADELSERERVRAQILAQGAQSRSGWLNADLSQSPVWVRWGVYLLVLAFLAGAAWGAFRGVEFLRGSL